MLYSGHFCRSAECTNRKYRPMRHRQLMPRESRKNHQKYLWPTKRDSRGIIFWTENAAKGPKCRKIRAFHPKKGAFDVFFVPMQRIFAPHEGTRAAEKEKFTAARKSNTAARKRNTAARKKSSAAREFPLACNVDFCDAPFPLKSQWRCVTKFRHKHFLKRKNRPMR